MSIRIDTGLVLGDVVFYGPNDLRVVTRMDVSMYITYELKRYGESPLIDLTMGKRTYWTVIVQTKDKIDDMSLVIKDEYSLI